MVFLPKYDTVDVNLDPDWHLLIICYCFVVFLFCFSFPTGWLVESHWYFYQVHFPMKLHRGRPTWSSASRWVWPGGRRGCAAGSPVWPRRSGSLCASASWSVAINSGTSAGTAPWMAEEASWKEVNAHSGSDFCWINSFYRGYISVLILAVVA